MKYLIAVISIIVIQTQLWSQQGSVLKNSEQTEERIAYIEQVFAEGETHASVWWWGWAGVLTASAGYSFYDAASTDRESTRIIQTVYGVQSTIGLAGLLLSRTPAVYGRANLQLMPSSSTEDKNKKLESAERLLKTAAEGEAFGRSWINHALNVAVNGAGALVIWKGYDSEIKRDGKNPAQEALVCFAVGMIVGEIQIFTQPTRAVSDWENYRTKYNRTAREREVVSEPVFQVAVYPGGFLLGAAVQF